MNTNDVFCYVILCTVYEKNGASTELIKAYLDALQAKEDLQSAKMEAAIDEVYSIEKIPLCINPSMEFARSD